MKPRRRSIGGGCRRRLPWARHGGRKPDSLETKLRTRGPRLPPRRWGPKSRRLSTTLLRRHERRGGGQIARRQRREHREHFGVQRQADNGDRGGELHESSKALQTEQRSDIGGSVS